MLPPMQIQTADEVWARIAEAAAGAGGRGVLATDADGTLWSGDVGDDLFHAFIAHATVHAPALEGMKREARDHGLSDAGSGSDVARRILTAYEAGTFPEERIFEMMAWCFAGSTRAEALAFARDALSRVGLEARMHREVMGLLARARKAGLDVLLVSASPLAAVVAGGERAGFDEAHVVAARARYEGDVMLPEAERPIPYGNGKVVRLREHLGPERPLLAAFGDNAFDVDMLGSARIGVAVRPKPRLRERAAMVAGLVELKAE
jgi:phosphatidylglycerophosphatase C